MFTCEFCNYDFPESCNSCPHCARPGLFPNVKAAEKDEESNALTQRYDGAMQKANTKGTTAIAQQFEQEVAQSQASIARPMGEIDRLTSSDRELYATYYQLINAVVRLPGGDDWARYRVLADESIFPDYKEKVRFAALTLNGRGVESYGKNFMVLREEMIAHRTSVFEENTVVWMKRQNRPFTELINLPKGYRATWAERGRLAVAKLGEKLQTTTTSGEFPSLLLQNGATSPDDDFIEAHIYGDLSIHSVKALIVEAPARKAQKHIKQKLEDKLKEIGAIVEVKT